MNLLRSDKLVQIIGLPQDNNSSYMTGPHMAPDRIREAFACSSANSWTETGIELKEKTNWIDLGNVELTDLSGPDAFQKIQTSVRAATETGQPILAFGGDHSVTFPVVDALAKKHPKINVLHIDAHSDLYEDMQGNYYSHASPFARLLSEGNIGRLVQVGIRTLNGHQREQAQKYNVEIHEMRDLSGVGEIAFDGPVYMSVDLDGLDPAFAPGVSHYEPGGLSTRAVLDLIHNFKGRLVGADIVELNPHRDPGNVTAMVAAKLSKELIGRMLRDT